ncbi:MAG: prolipoprotein diacylglyceryl transferase [Oscillospiraceae bacterium]|nr:prolipoprotein diacylglyceryl transferase [Oscillospiraceae bacterium]
MNPIAIYSGSLVIYWSALVIAAGLIATLFMTLSLQGSNHGRRFVVFLLIPLTVIFSVPLCRAIHWYCHAEQYGSLISALTDYSSGSYVLAGALLGAWLAALIASRLDNGSAARLLDAFAPGAALAIAFIRLSALFNSSCRSKIPVTAPALQHLPLASGVTNSAGQVEYRFATFFVQFLLMLVICYLLLRFFYRRRNVPMKSGSAEGNTFRMFLLYYGACELAMDSTRYDSSFMHFNGFVSLVQIVAAVSILALLIYYSVHSVRANRMRYYHWLIWIGWFLALLMVGISEYLVQRHGDWFLGCYGAMALGCFLMAFAVYRMYKSCCEE